MDKLRPCHAQMIEVSNQARIHLGDSIPAAAAAAGWFFIKKVAKPVITSQSSIQLPIEFEALTLGTFYTGTAAAAVVVIA